MTNWGTIPLLFAFLLGGCSEPIEPGPEPCVDPEPERWEVEPPAPPAEPASPELPRLRSWTCPEGWRAVEHESAIDETGLPFSWCEPPPIPRLRYEDYLTPLEEGEAEGDRPICDPAVDGTFPLVGFTECQPLGRPCPAGESPFPEVEDDPLRARLFVLEGARGGDGSEASPFGSIQDAIGAARPGDVIVIGEGTYPEAITIDREVTLLGACPERTLIDAPATHRGGEPSVAAVQVLLGRVATIRDLTITGAAPGIVNQGRLTVEGLWIHRALNNGLQAIDGTLSATRVLVTETKRSSDGTESGEVLAGIALMVVRSGSTGPVASLSSATLERNGSWNVLAAYPESQLSLEDVLIREGRPEGFTFQGYLQTGGAIFQDADVRGSRLVVDGMPLFGVLVDGSPIALEDLVIRRVRGRVLEYNSGGLWFQNGGVASLRRALIEEVDQHGIFAGPLDRVEAEDLVIRDIRPDQRGRYGAGVSLQEGGEAALSRTLIDGAHSAGLIAWGPLSPDPITSIFRVEDVVVLDTLPDQSEMIIAGISLSAPVEATVERALLRGNQGGGLFAAGEGTSVAITDLTLEGARAWVDAGCVQAVSVTTGAAVTLERGSLEGSGCAGVVIWSGGTTGDLRDLAIRYTGVDAPSQAIGLYLDGGAEAVAARLRIEGNGAQAITAAGDGTDLVVEDLTLPGETTPHTAGAGLVVVNGGHLAVTRSQLDELPNVAAVAEGEGSRLDLVDLLVRGTRPDDRLGRLGVGLGVGEGAVATALRARFEGSHQSGVQVFGEAELILEQVVIAETASSAYDGRLGRGLHAEGGARVQLTDCQLLANRDVGLSAFDEGTVVALDHVLIDGTGERACVELPATEANRCREGRGYGLAAVDGAILELDDVTVTRSSTLGLQLARGATVTGSGLLTLDSPVTLDLQEVEPDLDALLIGCQPTLAEEPLSIPERLPR